MSQDTPKIQSEAWPYKHENIQSVY